MTGTTAPLAARNLTFAYSPQVPIVKQWSEHFPAGAVTAITGPSGSGKSTVLYLLGLMVRPNAGQVCLDGSDVESLPDRQRARLRAHRFGFVFQDAALDTTRTVLDNIIETALYRGQSRRAATRSAHQLMERFGVQIRATHKPGQVSGGQAQRIALCRALLHGPRVVLADEPTGNLDPAARDTVLSALREHAKLGGCVIVATHDPVVIAACDHEMAVGGST